MGLLADGTLDAPANHGLESLKQSVIARGLTVEAVRGDRKAQGDFIILAGLNSGGRAAGALRASRASLPQGPQALVTRRTNIQGKPALILCGSDAPGLMYAALDAADRVSWVADLRDPFAEVHDAAESPYILERGVSIYTM